MQDVLIVGSGPSGVHFALSALGKGYRVTMVDIGHARPAAVNPGDSFRNLKQNLEDPARYFLGENFEGVLLPDFKKEYYGIPPGKEYVFRRPQGFQVEASGFQPLFSFARGGLAEVWTGGSYPFNRHELADFPFDYSEIGSAYGEVARRIGIVGAVDDLSRFFPQHDNLLQPLELDRHSALLLAIYAKHKSYLNDHLRCYLGRSRIATLSEDLGARKRCDYLGRCLWGCPRDSLYTPSATLAECQAFPNFTYLSGLQARYFTFTDGNRIKSLLAEPTQGGSAVELPVSKLVLAGGALCSTKIFLDSVFRGGGSVIELQGLMDNRQILVPFLNLRLIGQPYNPDTYQYHQLAIGICPEDPKEYVHALITTLKTALMHPILEKLPCDLRTAISVVRNVHCALGIINVNLHDTRREGNSVTIEPDRSTGESRLLVRYRPDHRQKAQIAQVLTTIKSLLWKVGCIVPPGMVHVRPMGASAHYAGMLPMSNDKRPYTTSKYGQSHDFENLWIADGATFPFLPAKNITFTLMANAIRIAHAAF